VILRPIYNPGKSCYNIAKATRAGGWARFGANWYTTLEDALRKIDEIVSRDPAHYRKDN